MQQFLGSLLFVYFLQERTHGANSELRPTEPDVFDHMCLQRMTTKTWRYGMVLPCLVHALHAHHHAVVVGALATLQLCLATAHTRA